ncbi:MAG: C4-type zinc ribbon domain-containing protein [Oscillospiraceae bacterium]|nr:C4-type zinc ribbon domain-containing protein [Oscillospiraceae bacterium]
MDQLELLWQYQQVDIEVERYEREMRANPNRQKLLKQRDFILDQQTVVKRIEGEVTVMADRLEALQDEVVRLRDAVSETAAALDAAPPQALSGVRENVSAFQKLLESITRYEAELHKMRKDAENRDKQQHEARVRAAKVKGEFDQLKAAYDTEYKDQQGALDKLKAQAQKAAEGITPAMLDHYNTIKRHSMPPMARLNEDRCGGCNMSLPSVVLHKIRSGSVTVECENCGRIILVRQE